MVNLKCFPDAVLEQAFSNPSKPKFKLAAISWILVLQVCTNAASGKELVEIFTYAVHVSISTGRTVLYWFRPCLTRKNCWPLDDTVLYELAPSTLPRRCPRLAIAIYVQKTLINDKTTAKPQDNRNSPYVPVFQKSWRKIDRIIAACLRFATRAYNSNRLSQRKVNRRQTKHVSYSSNDD